MKRDMLGIAWWPSPSPSYVQLRIERVIEDTVMVTVTDVCKGVCDAVKPILVWLRDSVRVCVRCVDRTLWPLDFDPELSRPRRRALVISILRCETENVTSRRLGKDAFQRLLRGCERWMNVLLNVPSFAAPQLKFLVTALMTKRVRSNNAYYNRL